MTNLTFALSDKEFEHRLEKQTFVGQNFWEEAIAHFLTDCDDYRCPYPERIHNELGKRTFRLFMEWTFQLRQDQMTDEIMSTKFGEIIQGVGLSLVVDEDERLNILFPLLPRVGDTITFHSSKQIVGNGKITSRQLLMVEKHPEIFVTALLDTGEEYQTSFKIS